MALTQRTARFVRHCCVFALFIQLSSAAPSAGELIQKVEKRYNGAQTLTVNFVETYKIAGHARPPESGTLTIRKQGKMRWDYSDPKGKLFISDGKSVFLYTARDNRVEKVPLKTTEDMRAPLGFLLGRLDLKKEFRDFRIREGDSGTWMEASASNGRTPYSGIAMLLGADGEIQRLSVYGRDESVVEYLFQNERLNVPAPERLFRFAIPAGAQVVDSVAVSGQEK